MFKVHEANKILLICAVTFTFLGCGRPPGLSGGSDNSALLSSSGGDFTILEALIFQPKCVGCHSQFGDYGSMMASGDVVAGNPQASKLYQRVVPGGGMPQGGQLSTAEITAIYQWIAAGALPPGGSISPTPIPSPTPPPNTASYTYLRSKIFQPLCLSCHQGKSAAKKYDLSTWQGTKTRVSGTPNSSTLYNMIKNGSMPPGGTVPAADLQALATWITAGAPNN